MKLKFKNWPNFFLALIIVVGAVWTLNRFLYIGTGTYTENAQIQQDIIPINSRIQGFISRIYFREFQAVHKGDTLVVIEDAEFRLRLAQAEADYQNALMGKAAMSTTVHSTQSNISAVDAGLEEVSVRLANAQRDYERFQALLAKDAVTQQQFEHARTEYEAIRAKYEQINRQKRSTTWVKTEQEQRVKQHDASISLAEASLRLARLQLSYTVIIAPADGVVGRKNIHEGQLVQPGQPLLNLVDSSKKWVVANYKESQMRDIRVGQAVDISVDALPGQTFKGVVESLSGATGTSYSLIPQDNSAGNFVKVEQRIPIRIAFASNYSQSDLSNVRAGMNVECVIKE